MAKETKLSEFEKGEFIVLKRVGKSQREISKALGHSKTVIGNYLKTPNKYGTRKPENPSRGELLAKLKRKLRQHQKYRNL